MFRWLRSILGIFAPTRRETGPPGPTSSNGASSFHLNWDLPGTFVEVSAELEVLEEPRVSRLFFWALQVNFVDANGRRGGGAHIGLQFHPRHPGNRAANWGGYRAEGGQLDGSDSPLPSARNNRNTRDFPWVLGRRYRLRVSRSSDPAPSGLVAWRGEVIDLETGRTQLIRDLYAAGEFLTRPVVWSEVFALCREPGAKVRWSSLRAVDAGGRELRPDAVRVNYQQDGGCPNTDSALDDDGRVTQTTAVDRVTPQGAVLSLV